MKKIALIFMLTSGLVVGLFILYQMEICRYKETTLFIRDAIMRSDCERSEGLKDAWERPMLRRIEQNGARIRVVSCGHDGKPDTKDDIVGIIEKDGDDFSSIVHWQYMFSSENLMEGEFTSYCEK